METLQEIMKWLKAIGFELVLFIAGIAGAFVNLTNRKDITALERVTTVMCGGLIANYMTPVFINFLNTSDSISYGMAFILGYMGLKSVEWAIDRIHKKLKDK